MNYSARINCARPRLGDRHDTAQISPPQRCHGYMDANRMKIKRNQCRHREAAKPRGSETCHHTKSQPIWTRIPAGSRRKPIHRNISEIVFSFFGGSVLFAFLPVRTPTRIWWSWFVKIIPSDAMFNSAVTRTENSRQGPEPSASNLEWRGRGAGARGGGGDGGGKDWGEGGRSDKMSGEPSDHQGHLQINGQDAGAV